MISSRGTDDLRLATAVMTHPARRAQAEIMRHRYPELDIEIVFDPEPDAEPATLRTARAAWASVPAGATHLLVLQDDVILCDGFLQSALEAVGTRPDDAITLFASWTMESAQAIRLAALDGSSWTPVIDDWTPTQALILPADLALAFAEHCAELPDWMPDNRAMATFLSSAGVTTYACIPSLAEHRPTPSLMLNDLLHGLREAVVCPDLKVGSPEDRPIITARGLKPPATAQLGTGGGGLLCMYYPLIGPSTTRMPAHELLLLLGMTHEDIAESFSVDLDRHPAAQTGVFGVSFLFQMWLAVFLQGVIARSFVGPVPGMAALVELETRNPWARPAMSTFPAGLLRRICAKDSLGPVTEAFIPLCTSALLSGLQAPDLWPDLAFCAAPDRYAIRPRWEGGVSLL